MSVRLIPLPPIYAINRVHTSSLRHDDGGGHHYSRRVIHPSITKGVDLRSDRSDQNDRSDDGGGGVIFTASRLSQFKDVVVGVVVAVVASVATVSLIYTYIKGDQLYTILAILL